MNKDNLDNIVGVIIVFCLGVYVGSIVDAIFAHFHMFT